MYFIAIKLISWLGLDNVKKCNFSFFIYKLINVWIYLIKKLLIL